MPNMTLFQQDTIDGNFHFQLYCCNATYENDSQAETANLASCNFKPQEVTHLDSESLINLFNLIKLC